MVRKRTMKGRRGLATVEFALVIWLLLFLSLGAIRYGHLFLKAQQITNAARNGARTAILEDATNERVWNTVNNLMAAAGMGDSGFTMTTDPANVQDADVNEPVTVRITVSCENISILHVPLFTNIEPGNGTWDLGARVTMAKEGY